MAKFRYTAMDSQGRSSGGGISADSRCAAIAQLAATGWFVTDMDEVAQASAGGKTEAVGATATWRRKALKGRARTAFFTQLATALQAGLPLLQAMHVVQEQADNQAIGNLIGDLSRRVQAGESLSQAMAAHPREFARLETSMTAVGETAGLLDQVMGYLAEFSDHDVEINEKVRSAAAYPMFVFALAVISVVIIVTFIVPRVLGALGENPGTLPWSTRALLGMSDMFRSFGWAIAILLLGGIWLFRRWLATPAGRLAFDGFKLKIPVLGPTLRRIAVARFARTLGTLSKSGIQILEALHVLRDTLGNEALARKIDQVSAGITQGQSIAEPLRQTGQFPPLLTQVIAMGERTGKLDELLLQTAKAYEKETSAAIARTMTILPAIFIVMLAVVVLFVLSAVLLPIINMETAVPGM